MRIIPVIIGILFFLTGVSLLFAGTAEEDPAEGLLLFQDVIINNEIKDIQCEGYYGATLTDGSLDIKTIKNIFEEIKFNNINIIKEDNVLKFKGMFSDTKGIIFFYNDKDKMFIGLNVYSSDLKNIIYTMKTVSDAFSHITSDEINTWTLKGSLDKRMTKEDMLMLAGTLTDQMDGKMGEEIFHPNGLGILGYSPQLLPGAEVNGKHVNLNLAFKGDSKEKITYFYAGVPFLTIPY